MKAHFVLNYRYPLGVLLLIIGMVFLLPTSAKAADLAGGGSLSGGSSSVGGGSGCPGCSYNYFDVVIKFGGVDPSRERNRAMINKYCASVSGLFKSASIFDEKTQTRTIRQIANVNASGAWSKCARRIFAGLSGVKGDLPADSCFRRTKPAFCAVNTKEQSGNASNFYNRQLHGFGTENGVSRTGNELQNYKKTPSSLNIIIKELDVETGEVSNVLVRTVNFDKRSARPAVGRGDRDCKLSNGICTNESYYHTNIANGSSPFGGPILGNWKNQQMCSSTNGSRRESTPHQLLRVNRNALYKLEKTGGVLPNSKTCYWRLTSGLNPYEVYDPLPKNKKQYKQTTFQHGHFGFAISVATSAKGELTSFKYFLNGRQNKAYLLQVFGLSGREYITHYIVDASMDALSQQVVEECIGPHCSDKPALQCTVDCDADDEQIDITEDGNMNRGSRSFSQEDPPSPFLSPQLVLNLNNSGYIKTGKSSLWNAYVEQPDGLISGIDRAIFLRYMGFRVGDTQVFDPSKTVDGQKFFGPDISSGTVIGITGQENGAFTVRTDNATSAWQRQRVSAVNAKPYWLPLTDTDPEHGQRYLIQARNDLAQRTVDPLSAEDNSFRAITSSLIPNQSEDEPTYGEMHLAYEQGRFVNDVDRLADRNCSQQVTRFMRGTNPDGSKTGPNAWINTAPVAGAVAQGFMYHQVAQDNNFGYVCRITHSDNYEITLEFASALPATAPATLTGSVHYSDYGFAPLLPSVAFNKVNATSYVARIPMKAFQNNELLSESSFSSGYLVTVSGIQNLGAQWRMSVKGKMDPQDIVQWAGTSDKYTREDGLPEGVGFGPDYDPFSPNSGAASGSAGSSCQLGECTVYSNILPLRVAGNTPAA